MSALLAYHYTPQAMLERALAAGSLKAVFQPVVRLDTFEVVAHEGLSRCAFMPGNFSILDLLDLARMEGRLADVELHAARTVCNTFDAMRGQGRLLVNLSAHAILNDALRPDDVLATLSTSGLDPARVTIEVTERDVVEDPARLAHALGYLRAHGVRIALDDFGTGYSSLSYLNRFSVDTLKVDRSFIQAIPEDRSVCVMVSAIVNLARSLGLTVVVEGTEREEQIAWLAALGPVEAQGFLFSRPVPADGVQALLDRFGVCGWPVGRAPRGRKDAALSGERGG